MPLVSVVDQTRCLVLDVVMPGMSGPDLQRELALRGKAIPIVFVTGEAGEVLHRRLIEAGAVECLLKPFCETPLLAAIDRVFGSISGN